MTTGWSVFVIIGTVVTVIASFWLIFWSSAQGPEAPDTGHSWDGLTERNEPLPRWWLWLFILTLIWGLGYLIMFPGFGSQAGVLGWSQAVQYDEEIATAEARYAPLFERFAALPDDELVASADALAVGRSLFANYCSQCHGSLGRGATAFPNLTDDEWLYGGSLAAITVSIVNGRNGIMPPFGGVFPNDAGLDEMIAYVRQMPTGQDTDSPAHQTYITVCSACHGPTGAGLQALGAPALNDDIWLYGSSPDAIRATIVNGRQGQMPAHGKLLGENRARLLAAYVYSLSNSESIETAAAK
ncbi:MAG: cytochrome-c oxidase, cbb3-type subunit III [Pseudomonadota bacterium]